jgi:hypothetical protein
MSAPAFSIRLLLLISVISKPFQQVPHSLVASEEICPFEKRPKRKNEGNVLARKREEKLEKDKNQ